jgi:hypothetical protein
MSKKFTPSQQRWPAIEQECFAIITAVKHEDHSREVLRWSNKSAFSVQ